MALFSSCVSGEVACRLLFSPLGSKAVARLACIVGGLALPAYCSFRAIELKDKTEQEHWLFYWTVYGCLSSGEILSDRLFSWLPGYYHAKLAFLMWLQLPVRNGSRRLLLSYISPVLMRYGHILDGLVKSARNDINRFLIAYLQELNFIKAIFHKLANYGLISDREAKDISKYLSEACPCSKHMKKNALKIPSSPKKMQMQSGLLNQ
ncbi:hypothetical protein KP509_25G017600 [Ceratopteris richardii]|uniref:HVA22-like protein n=1 Tax=Ceratopteris richardii TaxID=49495 RepID=A0A8T2RPH6_CERRI|nr:hypothetical protein KP509_25G017600 [Ceratopteris richardii]